MSLTCCATLAYEIDQGNIVKDDRLGLCVYGKPKYVNDGDGHYDDMTPSFPITYCPFCGEVLKDMEQQ